MPIPVVPAVGFAPGRHVCTVDEIEATFVSAPGFAESTTRADIWADWQRAVALLRGAAVVHAAWISGSFISGKLDPSDIDVLFVVNLRDRLRRTPEDLKVIESFERRITGALGNQVAAHGLRVDSFVLNWGPHNPDPAYPPDGMSPAYRSYVQARGYWDDWWSRSRVTAKGDPVLKKDSFPRRGYLEVNFDAYA